jgi:hypothetical protein
MAYIGIQPAEKFTSFATQEFSTSATTSYTLDHAVANENEIALFVNNVRQQPGSGKAYTATGTALTLSAATASTDTMYCVFLGRALQTVTPATNSITAAMVGNDLISGKTALAATPADTDELLISDAGTIKRIDFSHLKTGITMADQWRLSTTLLLTDSNQTLANNERVDSDGYGQLGTGMSHSSGIFTFPSTGIYLITVQAYIYRENSGTGTASIQIETTTDNSSYGGATNSVYTVENVSAYAGNVNGSFIFDVTDTSTHKVRFAGNCTSSNIAIAYADSNSNTTAYTFIRLGDT